MSNHHDHANSAANHAGSFAITRLFTLVQRQLAQWHSNEGLSRIYPQASELAQTITLAYEQQPGKFIAQLHQFKPNHDYLTNLTVKAVIFTAIQVSQQPWSRQCAVSLIAATLTSNVATLALLAKQAKGQPLDPTEKARLNNNAVLSHRLLGQNKVVDPLWLHSINTSSPAAAAAAPIYPVGLHGAIIHYANRFAHHLAQPGAGSNPLSSNQSVTGVLKAFYLDSRRGQTPVTQLICHHGAKVLHPLCEGTLVSLKNRQLALIMHSLDDDSHLAFLFPGQTLTPKGRFVVLNNRHIADLHPCYDCAEAKLYSLLWQAPLKKVALEKQLDLALADGWAGNGADNATGSLASGLFTPPKALAALIADVFSQASLSQIAQQVSDHKSLRQLLTNTASLAAGKDIAITDVKHAIAMLGLNRLGPLLTQGALQAMIEKNQFPGYALVAGRQQCFIQAVKYYARLSECLSPDELVLTAVFAVAPLYQSKTLQSGACRLYRQKTIDSDSAFCLDSLFALKPGKQRQQQVLKLAKNWQLSSFVIELLRHFVGLGGHFDSKTPVAKKTAHGLAVLRLATLHSHHVFNQLAPEASGLPDKAAAELTTLGVSPAQYQYHQQQLLADYPPYTPLI